MNQIVFTRHLEEWGIDEYEPREKLLNTNRERVCNTGISSLLVERHSVAPLFEVSLHLVEML